MESRGSAALELEQEGGTAVAAPRGGLSGAIQFLMSPRAGNFAVLALALLGGYLFAYREMRFFLVPSTSMESTLKEGDQIITLNETTYRRGDIVVVRDESPDGEYLVKRITGVGGDLISVRDGALYINGAYASEPYIAEPMVYEIRDPVEVEAGHYFLMGDNRNHSEDSSSTLETWPEEKIIGEVVYIYYPYDRMGVLRGYPLTNLRGE